MPAMKKLNGRTILLVNLVVFGIMIGFALAFTGFSLGAKRGSTISIQAESPLSKAPADVKAALAQAESVQNAFRYVAQAVLPSVVEVSVTEKVASGTDIQNQLPFDFFFSPKNEDGSKSTPQPREERGLGSGVIVRRDGKTVYVLTNDHVAGKASSIKVTLNDEREFEAKLVGTDERKDVALIKFETNAQDISIATLGDSSKLHVGDWAIAVGSPYGLVSSVTTGIVSALGRTGGPDSNINDFIQTDASINQGNSGGALVNIYGEVVGINTWIASPSGGSVGLGFAIPINNIKGAIDDFISHGQVKYGWLGVSLLGRDADKASAQELGIEGKKGAFVSQVFRKGPADKAGILPGDFITSADGVAVKGQDNLVRVIGDMPAGKTAEFSLIRGGKPITLSVKIEERDKTVASNDGNLYPGLDVVSLKSELIDADKLPKEAKSGVAVINVTAKSPAATIGVKPGDIITAVNEAKTDNLAEFYSALNDRDAKKISFTILRDGQEVSTLAYVKK